MGFFYKAGAGETVVEGASYDALATSAKTEAHGVLMKDTSTGFYYKNWKTGGPGIPIPAEYFDNIGGYFSNASGNAYYQLSDSLSDLTSRGFATGGTNAPTKSAGSALVVNTGTATNPATSFLNFRGTAASENLLCLFRLDSVSGGGAEDNEHVHLQVNPSLSNIEYIVYTRLNYVVNQLFLSKVFSGTPSTEWVGETSTIAPVKWVLVVSRADTANVAVTTARHLRDQKMVSFKRSNAATVTSSTALFQAYCITRDSDAEGLTSSEAHIFTLT